MKDNFDKSLFAEIIQARTGKKELVARRVVDLYTREDIDAHVQKYTQHMIARGVKPTLSVIMDYLYSKKEPNERDDFVKISTALKLMEEGADIPLVYMEVLTYAMMVEAAAINVAKEFEDSDSESIKTLKSALKLRLEVDEEEKKAEEQKEEETAENDNNQ